MSETTLVTGGAGYIGAHVVRALLDAGRFPVIVDDLSTGSQDSIPDGVPLLVANIRDAEPVQAFMREHACRSVIHMAGSVSVEESMRDPLRYFDNNTCASHAFVRSCIAEGVQNFIFSSTAAVYGNPDTVQVDEEVPANPVSPYGWSKLMTEKMLESAAAVESLNAVVLRYFNVAGADPQGRCGMLSNNTTHLLKTLCEVALGVRPKFTIFGDDYDTPDGTCIRDFIHVSDLADVHVAALDYLEVGKGTNTFNCGYGHGFSVRQVVETVRRLHGEPLNVEVGPRRSGDIVALVSDVTKLHSCLDWTPKHDDLDAIVKSSLQWEAVLKARG